MSDLVYIKGVTDLSLFVDNNESFLSKLKKVCVRYSANDIEVIKIFAKNFGNTIKCVEIDVSHTLTENSFNILMQQILNLKSLKN